MLPKKVVDAFETLRRGEVFPYAWLATLDNANLPRVRTVKVCGFNLNAGAFYVGTHSRHEKLIQLQANPRAELCVVDIRGASQLRFACSVTIHAAGESDIPLRERFWNKMSARSKIELYQGHPQLPKPPVTYVLLQLDVVSVELVQLTTPVGPVRS